MAFENWKLIIENYWMAYWLILIVFFIIAYLFVSKRASPIPYFPSNKKDIPLIIKALHLKNNQAVYDLGAGDGAVIFEAARVAFEKKLNTQFIAVEINPILIAILWLRSLLHPNRKHIVIVRRDMFNLTIPPIQSYNHTTIFIYISPWYHETVIKNIKKQIKKFDIVSYYYPVLNSNKGSKKQGFHDVYSLAFSSSI